MNETIRHIERIPSRAEVLEFIYHLFGNSERMEEQRSREDTLGLYLLEVRSEIPDEDGHIVELSYMRKGVFPEGKSIQSRIDVVFYDTDGIPVGGNALKVLQNDQWVNARL